jgi:hypothetical protein
MESAYEQKRPLALLKACKFSGVRFVPRYKTGAAGPHQRPPGLLDTGARPSILRALFAPLGGSP